ncbi:transglycosylase domain-containing protein [Dactylosporangium siamense]|uniref:Penicillin-binding protein 1A n=1 Tax=Dactylosporangium siamense TaxID=685454 RepID=A0A919PT15_9ACTN|nr:transglycosylase domain-containing protein [Dactylosporangium siamense]GIG47915.1 penicillin-binding protein 1A [Dactylosporangium siamense]
MDEDDQDRTPPKDITDSASGEPTEEPGPAPADLSATDDAVTAAAAGDVAHSTAVGARKRRRRKILLRSAAALVLIAALGLVGVTYYYDSVALPVDVAMQQATTIYYADGATPMARIGDTNRTVLPFDQIPLDVQHVVVAAQDETFYTNSGVDYSEAAGALWNQVTGGDTRGASTISQQYARQWAELEGASFGRKAREAVIATKLNEAYTKDQIMTMYLNIVYFGRGAYGIQAASLAYFGKPAKDLTMAEGVVLAGLIDNPEGTEGKGSPFDPTVDAKQARDRFDAIKRTVIKLNFVRSEDADQKLAYPAKVLTAAEARANSITVQAGLDKAEGLIVHHVLGEVAALTDPKTGALLYEGTGPEGKKHFDRIRNGGLKIVTTIDKTVQQIAVREGSRNAESNLDGQPGNLQAAIVAVEPGTGAVKAYYGGDSGNGGDFAGSYRDPVLGAGEDSCCGGHPAGASFQPYALATGLMAGYSTDSYWNGESPQEFPASGRGAQNPIRNAGENNAAAPFCRSGSAKWCTLDESTVLGINTPFFGLAEKVGPAKVIDTARAAGITEMWATVQGGGVRKVDLTQNKGSDVFPKFFNTDVAIGQYPVTVLDQAGGIATFAARGVAAKTHFLKEVWENGKKTYGEVINPKRIPGFTEPMADDLNAVLQGVPLHYGLKLKDGRPVAGATGAWQLTPGSADNAHAWMVGYTAYDPATKSNGLAVAVWVGNKAQEQKIVDKSGKAIIGGTLPGMIWRDFLGDAVIALKTPIVTFPAKQGTGDKTVGTGVSPGP